MKKWRGKMAFLLALLFTLQCKQSSSIESGGGSRDTSGSLNTADRTAPNTPAGVSAIPLNFGSIFCSWNTSTDDVSVAGYKIFRNEPEIATTAALSYTDKYLAPGSTYRYSVLAYDAAGNLSSQSDLAAKSPKGRSTNTFSQVVPAQGHKMVTVSLKQN